MSIESESQLLAQSAIVDLFEVFVPGTNVVLRFTPSTIAPTAVKFGGEEYDPLPAEISGIAYSGQGELPQPKLTVSGLSLGLLVQMAGANNLIGAKLVHRRTYAKFLDTGEAVSHVEFEPTSWVLSQMKSQSDTAIEYLLRAEIDRVDVNVPRRQCLRTCSEQYRTYNPLTQKFDYSQATCPYAGADMFDINGERTTDPAQDVCSLQYTTGCKKRYGNAPCPFSGVPNIRNRTQ